MSKTARLHIVYDGPALANHEMDVRELAPAMMAMGEVLEEANRLLNGDRAKVSIKVKGSFKTGSFGIDFSVAQSWADQLFDLMQSHPVAPAATLLSLLGLSARDLGKARRLRGLAMRTGLYCLKDRNRQRRVHVNTTS